MPLCPLEFDAKASCMVRGTFLGSSLGLLLSLARPTEELNSAIAIAIIILINSFQALPFSPNIVLFNHSKTK